MDKRSAIEVTGRKTYALAWLTLTAHSLTVALWKPVFLTLFLVGWLMVLGGLGGFLWLAVAGMTANVIAIGWTLITGIRTYHNPDDEDVLRHLEHQNQLPNRPLRSLTDLPADGNDPTAETLWRAHIKRLTDRLSRLKVGLPAPVIAGADPLALRFLVILLLIFGSTISNQPILNQMAQAFDGNPFSDKVGVTVALDAWVNPPEYTNQPPIILDKKGRKAAPQSEPTVEPTSELARKQAALVSIPAGSELIIRASHTDKTPFLIFPDQTSIPLQQEGEGQFAYRGDLENEGIHLVRIGSENLATWDVNILPDNPPTIAFADQVRISQRNTILINYSAQDDYGVAEIKLHLRRVADPDKMVEEIILPVGFRDRQNILSNHYLDLTPHPWAGLNVIATLVAEDDIEQSGISQAQAILLPQRVFKHPVASAIIRERRNLAEGVMEPEQVARNLRDIAWRVEAYNNDKTVFLALGVSSARLYHRKIDEQIPSVLSMLWKTALRLEDGDVSLAAQDMLAAEKELLEAIANGADQEEIDRLMDQMEEAMANFLEAMAREQDQQEENPDGVRESGERQMISPGDIKSMMDKIRELLKMGMIDEAQKLLAEMRQLMQNLKAAPNPFASGEGKEALEMLKDLQNVMQDQQNMLEQTHNKAMGRNKQGGQSNNGNSNAGQELSPQEQASMQEQLRQRLNDLGDRVGKMLGDKPGSMDQAGQSMGQASQALGQGRTHRAAQSQGQALNHLQESARAIQQAIIEKFGGAGNSQQTSQGDQNGSGRDPFGRTDNVGSNNRGSGDQKIQLDDMERVRQLRDELRRRSGDQDRPPVELDYIDRLLTPF